MSAVNEIIRFAERLREAEEKLKRLDSVEQACGEAESRLASLRAQEHRLEADCSKRRVQLNEQENGAKVQAEAIRKAAEADAAKLRQAATDWCRAQQEEALANLATIDDAVKEKRATIANLEDDEARLAQAVVRLRSELESLRARVLG